MKVSVLMVTYNHEKYIAQAIESVLMQRAGFDYELIIGEDCSTDQTRAIVRYYYERFPHKIKVFFNAHNLGMMANAMQVASACTGQYSTALDGDDYWTSPDKLQKQVDFMDSHPDFALCCHNVQYLYEHDPTIFRTHCTPNQKEVSTIEDLILNNFISTCSVMTRNGLLTEFPAWVGELKLLDWPMHILNAQHGKIKYINEVMSVYRIHGKNAWASQTTTERGYALLKMYEHLNPHLEFQYERAISQAVINVYTHLAVEILQQDQSTEFRLAQLAECIQKVDQYKRMRDREGFHPLPGLEYKNWNLLFAPDWEQAREQVYEELAECFRALAQQPEPERIALFVWGDRLPWAEVKGCIADVVMGLAFEEEVEVPEAIYPITGMEEPHWQFLLPRLQGVVGLPLGPWANLPRVDNSQGHWAF